MPSVSNKQHNLMAMVANDPAAAKRVGIPQSVGEEYMKADKGKKFGSGGGSRADLQAINKPKVHRGKMELFAKGGEMAESKKMAKKEISFMEKKGAPKSMIKHEKEEYGMKKGGMKKMAMGGPSGNLIVEPTGPRRPKPTTAMASGGITTAKMGAVRTAAPSKDGIAAKGKTKGTQIKMAASKPLGMKRGGKC